MISLSNDANLLAEFFMN